MGSRYIISSNTEIIICKHLIIYGNISQMPDEPNATLLDSEPFISKEKITRKSPDDGNKKGVEIAGLLNYLSNFLRTLEKELVDCETNHISKWPSTCIITNSSVARTFAITDTKPYVPVVILSTQDSAKLLQQL